MIKILPSFDKDDYLCHYGIKGQKKGVRRYQNYDGSLTPLGYIHYGYGKGKRKNKAGNDSLYYNDDGTLTEEAKKKFIIPNTHKFNTYNELTDEGKKELSKTLKDMEKDYDIPKNAKKVKPEAKQYFDAYNESNKMYDKLRNEFINLPVGNKEFNDCIEKAYNDCMSHKLNRNIKPEEKKSFINYFDELKKAYIENSEIYDDLWNRYVKAREVGDREDFMETAIRYYSNKPGLSEVGEKYNKAHEKYNEAYKKYDKKLKSVAKEINENVGTYNFKKYKSLTFANNTTYEDESISFIKDAMRRYLKDNIK